MPQSVLPTNLLNGVVSDTLTINSLFWEELAKVGLTLASVAFVALVRLILKTMGEFKLYRHLEMESIVKQAHANGSSSCDRNNEAAKVPNMSDDTTLTISSWAKRHLRDFNLKRRKKLYNKLYTKATSNLTLSSEKRDSNRVESSADSSKFFRPVHRVKDGKNTEWFYAREADYPLGRWTWFWTALWRSTIYKRSE